AAGYAQGVGNVADNGPSVQDISGPGANFQLSLGARVIPNLSVGAYGSFAVYGNSDLNESYDVRGATAGVVADWPFRPHRSLDPWLGLASGWRGEWFFPESGEDTSLQGWEIARLQGGLDYRCTPELAAGPLLSVSLNEFFQQSGPRSDGFEDIDAQHANLYF